jgi:spermidine/putrescine transport system substrate-binding protein
MKRYFLFSIFIAILLSPLLLNLLLHNTKTLQIFCWSSLLQPDVIQEFENRYHCRVVIDTYDSNEAMYTKLKLGGGGYDIVFPSNYFLELMSDQALLAPLMDNRLKNTGYIDWTFIDRLGITKTSFGIPFSASFVGVGYRNDRLSSPEESWNIFADTKLAGRMTMLNDMRDTLGASLLYLGSSVNTHNPIEIANAGKQIRLWKRNIAKFESEQYKNGLISGEYLAAQGYTSDFLQAMRVQKSISFFYPKEGSCASVDYVSITKQAQHIDLAYAFLDFLLEPRIAAKNSSHTCCRSLNKALRSLLPLELQNSPLLFPEDSSSITLETIVPVGKAQKYYLQEWNKIKNDLED